MPRRTIVLLTFVIIAFVTIVVVNYLRYPAQFNVVTHIIFGIIILMIGSMGLKAPDISLEDGGISRVIKVLFGCIVIAFLSWLIIGVVTQPLVGNVVFEMVNGKFFLPSMLLLTLAFYPVINRYLI